MKKSQSQLSDDEESADLEITTFDEMQTCEKNKVSQHEIFRMTPNASYSISEVKAVISRPLQSSTIKRAKINDLNKASKNFNMPMNVVNQKTVLSEKNELQPSFLPSH